jgi:peptidoglycan/LPS O-acetylase OafA/YrhL
MTLMLFADDFLHSRADTHWLSMAKNLALNLLLIQSWGFGSPIDGPAWSISTEFAAYLLFPVLLAATVYRPLRYALMVGVMCFFAVGAISLLPTPASYQFPRMGPLDISWQHSPWPMVRCLLEFSVGLVAYRIDQETEIGATLAQPINAAIIGFVMLLALFIPRGDMLFFAAIPALLLSLAHSRNFAAHFFGSRSAVFLGDISFAVYLLHWALLPIRERLGPVFGDAGALAIFYVSLIVGAWGLYNTIEKPCRDGVRKFERRILRPQDRATLPQM